MTMETMDYGIPMEGQEVQQTDAAPETLEMEGGLPAVMEGASAEELAAAESLGEQGQEDAQAEPPPKKKRTAKKKAEKEDSGVPEESTVPLDAPANGDMPAAGDAPPGGDLPEDDGLDPQSGGSEAYMVMGLADQEESAPPDGQPLEEGPSAEEKPPVEQAAPLLDPPPASETAPQTAPRPRAGRPANGHSSLLSLKLNELDRNLTEQERQEWNDIYASFRSKSVLTGKIIGVDAHAFHVRNRESGQVERRRMYCAAIIAHRVKVLIPETEMWMPGEERPTHVLRNMSGAEIDYVILDVDREGGMAIASRRMGVMIKRRSFDTARGGHEPGERLNCRILTVGPSRCLVECGGRDITLRYQDMSYASYSDLREKYHPGETLDCVLKGFDRAAGRLTISVKEAAPNPFEGAALRHPLGCRRQAVISGKYGGGVFCTMPDGTTCLCLYTAQHTDRDFREGDTVIVVIVKYDYERSLIYGRILSKW
ncbi:MAG: hypothetical protein NC489_23545 [Ruminococcus flavefaciens]|nr:hypothetical protein [Ruminococcus flavefaciens]